MLNHMNSKILAGIGRANARKHSAGYVIRTGFIKPPSFIAEYKIIMINVVHYHYENTRKHVRKRPTVTFIVAGILRHNKN